MWPRSNTPQAVRTAACSVAIPANCTGMSQPWKSTIFAPRADCTAYNTVLSATPGSLWFTIRQSYGRLPITKSREPQQGSAGHGVETIVHAPDGAAADPGLRRGRPGCGRAPAGDRRHRGDHVRGAGPPAGPDPA